MLLSTYYSQNYASIIRQGLTIVHWAEPENFALKMILWERAFQEEQDDTNLSSVALSSEELYGSNFILAAPSI